MWSHISWSLDIKNYYLQASSLDTYRDNNRTWTQILKYHDITFNLHFQFKNSIDMDFFHYSCFSIYLETCRHGSGIGTFPNVYSWASMFLGGRWERQWIKFVWRNYCNGGKKWGEKADRSFMVVLVKQIYLVLCNWAKINVTWTLQRIILSWTVTWYQS